MVSSLELSSAQADELARLNALLTARDGELRVARLGGAGVGHALTVYRITSWVEGSVLGDHPDPRALADDLRARHSALLTDVLVVPGHRRRGIGRALVEDSLALVRAAGLHEVTLFVAASNDAARRIYDRLGFVHARTWPHVLEYVLKI